MSIEDAEMRHGRKSSSHAFNGYKRHVATDLDSGLIVAAAITPANLPEMTAMPVLQDDFEHQHIEIRELFIDRGYIASDFVEHVQRSAERVLRVHASRHAELDHAAELGRELRRRARCAFDPAPA